MTARFIYFAIESLDGYIEDVEGKFDWGRPDEEVHRFVNDVLRQVGTYLYGRRMYETMQVWETEFGKETDPPWARDFAGLWRAAEKVVFSKTLKQVSTRNTRLERAFDARAVREMKGRAGQDLAMGGHGLATHAFRAGLIDEVHLLLAPIIVGGGKRALPDDMVLKLELIDQRRFERSSVAYLRYAVR
jgi:dihydrofolate reductase